jgi:hypothetical protein
VKFLIILVLSIISMAAWSGIDLRIDLPNEVKAGELLSLKAEIIKIDGVAQLSVLRGQTLQDTLYINKVGVIEKNSQETTGSVEIEIIFLKPIDRIPLVSSDGGTKVYLTSVKVLPSEEVKDFIIVNWSLPWKLPWYGYLSILLSLIAGLMFFNFYPKWKEKKRIEKKQKQLWDALISANSEKEIMDVWTNKLTYFESFPELETQFRAWEKVIYPFLFKKVLSDEEKNQILKSYKMFVSNLPLRRGRGV